MSKMLICPDVSEFQPSSLDHTFTRDFVIFRATFGAHKLDSKFLANASAAKRLYNEGRLAGVLLYTGYTSDPVSSQFDAVWQAIGPTIPPWLTGIMIDVESWRGHSYELSGDHSQAINALYGMHAHRMNSFSSVIAYGNAGDLAELYPGRDKRCRVIVASYGPHLVQSSVRGAIGQQYTDGSGRWAVPRVGGHTLPVASAPFGRCDHNVFPDHPNGTSLVRLLRPAQLDQHRTHVPAPEPRPRQVPPVPARHRHDAARSDSLVSRNGRYALLINDNGSLEVRNHAAH